MKRKKEEKEKLKAKRQDPVAQANEAMEHFVDDDKEYYKKEVSTGHKGRCLPEVIPDQ